jgi:hypothetical protein
MMRIKVNRTLELGECRLPWHGNCVVEDACTPTGHGVTSLCQYHTLWKTDWMTRMRLRCDCVVDGVRQSTSGQGRSWTENFPDARPSLQPC